MNNFNLIKPIFSFTSILTALAMMAGCNKSEGVKPTSSSSNPKGYLVVNCTNCMVQYGMPDQYQTFNTSGTSPKADFTYTTGYTLVTYITALGQTQDLTLSVYNSDNAVIYQGTVKQSTTGYWSTNVPITDSLATKQ